MTALAERRQHNLRAAGAIGAVSVLLTMLAIVVGASSLANSDAGRDVTGGASPDRLRFPATPTAAIGLLDHSDDLISVGMFVLRPEGFGGNLIVVPAQSDVTPGPFADVEPDSLANQWSQGGQDRFKLHLESVSAVSLDLVKVMPVADLPALFGVADPLRWALTDGLETDTLVALSDSEILGRSVLPGVERDLTHTEFAALMSWTGPDVRDANGVGQAEADSLLTNGTVAHADLEKIRISLWAALLAGMPAVPDNPLLAVSGDAGDLDDLEDLEDLEDVEGVEPTFLPGPRDLAEFLSLFSAGEKGIRGLTVSATSDPAVVALDRAEVLMIFGQIAPARVAAPNESSRFRVVAHLDSAQQVEIGATNADLARDLIAQLLFLDANVLSVQANDPSQPGAEAPQVTVMEVADAASAEVMAQQWSRVFGEIEISVVEVAIEGVDATIIIGMNYVSLRSTVRVAPNRDGDLSVVPSSEE